MPVEDVALTLAQLSERCSGHQRQIDQLLTEVERVEQRGTDLTDAKFVTYRTLIDSQAERVKLALEATEKAIGKAEIATQKAIEKESETNYDRFAKVNEFRAQQSDLIARFASQERVDLLYNQTRVRMDEVSNNVLSRLSEAGDRITELGTRLTAMEASARGAAGNRHGIYAAIGAATAVVSVIVVVANSIFR